MKQYMGIDGGGTKTEFVVCDERGHISKITRTGPSNPIFIDEKVAFSNLDEGIKQLLNKNNYLFECCTICIPGIKYFAANIEKNYSQISKKVIIGADELNTYYSALGDTSGVVVLSGTGSFAIGENSNNEIKSFGGWGPLVGDEGSGYYIGILCLKEVIRAYENKITTTLINEIKKYFNIDDICKLRSVLYKEEISRENIARLSKVVKDMAEVGDQIAIQIINKAGGKLADLAKTAIEQLELQNEPISVVLTGGVSKMKELIDIPFAKSIKDTYPKVKIQQPRFEPSVGALILSLKESNVEVNQDILNELEESYKVVNIVTVGTRE